MCSTFGECLYSKERGEGLEFQALMSMFQILTQEGWTEIVVDVMRITGGGIVTVLVAIYFVAYHLFVTLVSIFPLSHKQK